MKKSKAKTTNKITMAVFAVAMIAGVVNAQTWNIGIDADSANVTATLDGETLTIRGTGDMRDFNSTGGGPWVAFSDQIYTVAVGSGITTIGVGAFSQLHNLTSITIPEGVNRILGYAFSGTNLTSIDIPHSVTFVANTVLAGSNVTHVTIGDGLLLPSTNTVFTNSHELISIEVSPTNPYMSSVDGVLFNKDRTILVQYPQGRADLSYIIPSSVRTIRNRSFNNVTKLSTLIIPSTVTTVQPFAFSTIRNLNRMDFLKQEPIIFEMGPRGEFPFDDLHLSNASPSLIVYGFDENTTVRDANLASWRSQITFVPYHGLSLSQSETHAFDSVQYGDTPPLTVTLANTNYPLGTLSIALSSGDTSAFTINQSSIPSVALGESATFTVTPRLRLTPGTYTATVTASVTSNTGGNAGIDWITPQSFDVSVTIIPRPVTIIGVAAANKEYDGTTSTDIRGEAIINGMVSGDDVTVVSGIALFADMNVGTGKPIVAFTDFSLAGTDATNYILTSQPSSMDVTANIIPRVITITGVTAIGRDPDGTTSVTLSGGTLVGVVDGDNVGFTLGSGIAASAEIGIQPVTTNIVLTGPDAFNYTLSQPEITINIGNVSIADIDREIPVVEPDEAAVIVAPANQSSGEFTVGPNPVDRLSGVVNFYRQGRRVNDAVLTIFDAFGNVVNRIGIADVGTDFIQSRVVGSWDLTSTDGRPVSAGTYLLRGTVATADGSRERVSVIIGVR
ncbi:MAG: YDG domain-containing protein [Chitinispirillales bacterium]|jgi:hypothetical protein|nr:YDG domain-containing protein [Chitinispirillales bacterium]